MKLIIGPPPDDADFAPELEGWRKLREPGPVALILVGSLAGIPLAALVNYAWSEVTGTALNVQVSFSPDDPLWIVMPLIFLAPWVFFATVIFVHELIHDLACPGFGLTQATVLGF